MVSAAWQDRAIPANSHVSPVLAYWHDPKVDNSLKTGLAEAKKLLQDGGYRLVGGKLYYPAGKQEKLTDRMIRKDRSLATLGMTLSMSLHSVSSRAQRGDPCDAMRLVIERFAHNALALLAVTTILFFMFRLMPGTPLAAFINENLNADQQQAMLEQFGLDKPLWRQYFIYLANLLQGEMGLSFFQRRSVTTILLEVLPNSVILTLTSLIIAYIFGVPGRRLARLEARQLARARRRAGRAGDPRRARVLDRHGAARRSCPSISAGSRRRRLQPRPRLHQQLAAHPLARLPPAPRPAGDHAALYLQGLPLLLMRSNMLEVMHEEFVTMARMKGLSEWRIVIGHAARNALLPVVTAFALGVGLSMGGNVVIETVFSWPGIGRLLVQAVSVHDYPLAQGAFLMIAAGAGGHELRRRPALHGPRPTGEPWPKGLSPCRRGAAGACRHGTAPGDDAADATRSPSPGITIYILFALVALFRRPARAGRPDGDPVHQGGQARRQRRRRARSFRSAPPISGRDIYAQLIYGTRSALAVGLSAAVIVATVGTVVGLLSGYFGGWVDSLLMRIADMAARLPFLPFRHRADRLPRRRHAQHRARRRAAAVAQLRRA
jgi:peptide/nickel transport system permease protein